MSNELESDYRGLATEGVRGERVRCPDVQEFLKYQLCCRFSGPYCQ